MELGIKNESLNNYTMCPECGKEIQINESEEKPQLCYYCNRRVISPY
jgi:hypothetical protein